MVWRMRRSAEAGKASPKALFYRWRKDEKGATAVEFGLVALPFIMMLFGIIAIGLYFFTTFTLENAVEQASRQIRTGQAQQANMTPDQFRTAVCSFLPGNMPCDSSIQVNVQSYPDSASITADSLPKCLDGGGSLSNATQFTPGAANVIVLVWVCYEWKLASKIPFLRLGDMGNGSRLIQATTTFRTEPYTN
jgi:Flp pilus assembly protein TadG